MNRPAPRGATSRPRPPKSPSRRSPPLLAPRPAPPARTQTTTHRPHPPHPSQRSTAPKSADRVLDTDDQRSLLDVVDNLLNNGVVLTGEVTLGLAGVDLVYLKLSAILCAADRLIPVKNRP